MHRAAPQGRSASANVTKMAKYIILADLSLLSFPHCFFITGHNRVADSGYGNVSELTFCTKRLIILTTILQCSSNLEDVAGATLQVMDGRSQKLRLPHRGCNFRCSMSPVPSVQLPFTGLFNDHVAVAIDRGRV
jgi:hypothetical protein